MERRVCQPYMYEDRIGCLSAIGRKTSGFLLKRLNAFLFFLALKDVMMIFSCEDRYGQVVKITVKMLRG
jgi:hypothetical protein